MAVYLLGAGPGDPGLLTVKGASILRQADAVVYDRLANFPSGLSILNLAPDSAEKIYVGKSPDGPRVKQPDINALLIKLAKKHKVVVRLKGGDPFVFARGGEEAEALAQAGVPYEIIPGITSPIAVPAYAGIPVTFRHSSTSFTVITGHVDPENEESIDWEAAAKLGGTLIILMGVARFKEIASKLLSAGMSADTPVAAVRWGTRPNQKTIRATLATLDPAHLEPPMTIVIGSVAEKNLSWFESLPLFSKKIGVTRDEKQAESLASDIFSVGGEPVVVPLIKIAPPRDGGEALLKGLFSLDEGDWLVCNSTNAVSHLFDVIKSNGHDVRMLGVALIAAVGDATAREFGRYSFVPDLVPKDFSGEGLVKEFPDSTHYGQKVLIVAPPNASETVPKGLEQKYDEILVCEAYHTKQVKPAAEEIERLTECDVITFASPSAVESFVSAGGDPSSVKLAASIGPVTESAVKEAGFKNSIVAERYDTGGLVDALVKHFSS